MFFQLKFQVELVLIKIFEECKKNRFVQKGSERLHFVNYFEPVRSKLYSHRVCADRFVQNVALPQLSSSSVHIANTWPNARLHWTDWLSGCVRLFLFRPWLFPRGCSDFLHFSEWKDLCLSAEKTKSDEYRLRSNTDLLSLQPFQQTVSTRSDCTPVIEQAPAN